MNDDARGLVPLHQQADLKVADGNTDVRGFAAFREDGQRVGTVGELMADPAARRVAGIALEVDRQWLADGAEPTSYVEIEDVEIDTAARRVVVRGPGVSHLGLAAPAAPADDVTQLMPAGDERRITLAEEELAIRKERVPAGEVEVVKRVETEHVRESVPVTTQEVSVERRPVSGDVSADGMAAGVREDDDEIRIPIVEEELVVETRQVVREELVIRKDQVTREQIVEADLRKERAEVHDRQDLHRPREDGRDS